MRGLSSLFASTAIFGLAVAGPVAAQLQQSPQAQKQDDKAGKPANKKGNPPAPLPGKARGLTVACSKAGPGEHNKHCAKQVGQTYSFNFATQSVGWISGVADYAPHMQENLDFVSGVRSVPGMTGTQGYLLGANNPSDDVAMYVYRKVEGLQPNTPYKVDTTVIIATNAPSDCLGIGGGTGSAVAVKAGAAPREPSTSLNSEDLLVLNINKGNQMESGSEVRLLGNIGSPDAGECDAPHYARKTLSSGGAGPSVRTDASGALWLILTTDSGFEGRTEIYLLEAQFTLAPA